MKEIVSATIKTGGATFISTLFRMVTTKIFALTIGAYGIGMYSLLTETVRIGMQIGTFNGRIAIVQGTAKQNNDQKNDYLATIFILYIVTTILIAIVFIFFQKPLSHILFQDENIEIKSLVGYLYIPIIISIFGNFLTSVLNGYKAFGQIALVEIACAIMVAIIAYPFSLLIHEGYYAVFILIITINETSRLGFSLFFAFKAGWLRSIFNSLNKSINMKHIHHFFAFSGITAITATVTTLTLLLIKVFISQIECVETLGYFEVSWRISMTYVMLILSSFGTYYLPALASTKSIEERDTLIRNVQRLALILSVPIVVLMIILKPIIIEILYSDKFMVALQPMRWMLIGDFFRITSWCYGHILLAFEDLKIFLLKELSLQTIFFTIVYCGLKANIALEITGIAFLVINIINLIFLTCYIKRSYGYGPSFSFLLKWLAGLGLITCVSILTWNTHSVSIFYGVFFIAITILFSFYLIHPHERHFIYAKLRRMSIGRNDGRI